MSDITPHKGYGMFLLKHFGSGVVRTGTNGGFFGRGGVIRLRIKEMPMGVMGIADIGAAALYFKLPAALPDFSTSARGGLCKRLCAYPAITSIEKPSAFNTDFWVWGFFLR
jgi:hypothetical protein